MNGTTSNLIIKEEESKNIMAQAGGGEGEQDPKGYNNNKILSFALKEKSTSS